MKKGDIVEGVIEEVKFPNRGIFHNDWGTIEVKNVLPGQKVRARITRKREKRAEAILLEVVEKAPDEVPAPCPQFGRCGGCTYLNLPYDRELTLKQIQVMKLLQQGVDEGKRMLASAGADTSEDTDGREFPTADAKVISTKRNDSSSSSCSAAASKENPAAALVHSDNWENVFTWYEGIHSSPKMFGYRNKMEFTFGDEIKGGPMTLGMHKRGSFHDIVDADACVIADADFRMIVRTTRDFFAQRQIPFYHRFQQKGWLRHLLVRKGAHTGEILIDLVTTSQKETLIPKDTQDPAVICLEEHELLQAYANTLLALPLEGDIAGILHTRNDSLADVVEDQGTEVLFGRDYFEESLLGMKFVVTPFSFFQTNSYGAETLYTIVRQYIQDIVPPAPPTYSTGQEATADSNDAGVGERETVQRPVIYDLYCGTGTISQLVAPVARKVIGVEIVKEAVDAARENCRRNHVPNCEFIAGDVLKVLDTIEEKPDLIILDPPRDGIHPKALPKILSYDVPYILYISCKPTSLARDLPAFIAAGYRPVAGCSVDQFAWTGNVETVVLLSNTLKKKPYVTLDVDMDDYYCIKAESEKTEKNAGKSAS